MFAMLEYGTPSTTARVLVNDEGVNTQSLLKIQSRPTRKGDSYFLQGVEEKE